MSGQNGIREVANRLLQEQRSSWRKGLRTSVEELLREHPQLSEHAELVKELIQQEISLRRELNEPVSVEDLSARFPDFEAELREWIAAAPLGERVTLHTAPQAETVELVQCAACGNRQSLRGDLDVPVKVQCRVCGAPISPAAAQGDVLKTPPPRLVAQFELLTLLGEGGFGAVWKARDTILNRFVALKLPRLGRHGSAHAKKLLGEARTAAKLQHPGIVRVYEVGEAADAGVFIASELIEGRDLQAILAEQKSLPWEKAVELVAKIADALQHAHEKGVVHRDIKPANILIDEHGVPHVADFGVALTEERFTHGDERAGTVLYMSPEQISGKSGVVDGRADIYSLGVVLYVLIAGRPPYRGRSITDLEKEIVQVAARPLQQLNSQVPDRLDEICLRCLEKQPENRYSSAARLATALRSVQNAPGPTRKNRRAFAIAIAVLTLASAAVLLWPKRQPLPARVSLTVTILKANDKRPADVIYAPGALPLRNGDLLRVQAELDHAAYIYLFWVDGANKIVPLAPWSNYDWNSLPVKQAPSASLQSPLEPSSRMKVEGDPGAETIVLVVTSEAVTNWQFLHEKQLPHVAPDLNGLDLVWEWPGPTKTSSHSRGPGQTVTVDEPQAQLDALVRKQLGATYVTLRTITMWHSSQ